MRQGSRYPLAVSLPSHPFQIAGSLAKARLGGRTPLKVTHLLTYACNVECGFCTRIHIPSNAMQPNQVVAMMETFARLGTRWWVFNGGEPTLVKPLGRYIAQARDLDFHATMVTNGIRIVLRIDELKDLDLVICSIHGPRETHDRILGREGSFDEATRGLRMLRDQGVEVCMLAVLNERNRDLLEEMLCIGEELGIGVAFQPVVETRLGGAQVPNELVPRQGAMADAVDWLLQQKMANRPVSCSQAYLEALLDSWPDRPFDVNCWAGRLFCEVTPEGFVVPCCSEEEYTFARCHGPTVGWERAFLALPDRSECRSCWFKGPQEINLLLSMQPSHLARAARNAARGRLLWD